MKYIKGYLVSLLSVLLGRPTITVMVDEEHHLLHLEVEGKLIHFGPSAPWSGFSKIEFTQGPFTKAKLRKVRFLDPEWVGTVGGHHEMRLWINTDRGTLEVTTTTPKNQHYAELPGWKVMTNRWDAWWSIWPWTEYSQKALPGIYPNSYEEFV